MKTWVNSLYNYSMPDNISAQYKKSWLINTTIARELACYSPGDKLPTIQELTERLQSSRGIVQKALSELQRKGGIDLEKRGKMGTFIGELDRKALFREGGLEYITATMPSPLTFELIALASGICETMNTCPVPFNFAFIQSAGLRALALSRSIADFAVTSLNSAKKLCVKYPNLSIMVALDKCIYSQPYMLFSNKKGNISSGDRIAADPGAIDQYHLTKELCKGKKIVIIERPYLTCRAMFLAGDIDYMVYRHEQKVRGENFKVTPIENGDDPGYIIPALLISKNNYNIANILKPYLCPDTINEGQTAVMNKSREPIIY